MAVARASYGIRFCGTSSSRLSVIKSFAMAWAPGMLVANSGLALSIIVANVKKRNKDFSILADTGQSSRPADAAKIILRRYRPAQNPVASSPPRAVAQLVSIALSSRPPELLHKKTSTPQFSSLRSQSRRQIL
jgi:hypothetical protein